MEGLPFLPGYTVSNFNRHSHHVSHNFKYKNGYMIARPVRRGIGDSILDTDGIQYCLGSEPLKYDPSLTYGRTQQHVPPAFKPHFVLYDKKCLAFQAFFKQGVPNSPHEHYRVRHVKIVYFLEDDTMQIAEPSSYNPGYPQGTIVRRCKLTKNTLGEFYHWKDLNVGIDLTANGIVYHVVSCDKWSREFLTSQGVEVGEDEPLPKDPYTDYRLVENRRKSYRTPSCKDGFYKFLLYDKKVLCFTALWDDRERLYGNLNKAIISFYLVDDTMEIVQLSEDRKETSKSTLMSRRKVPKKWYDPTGDFPSIYLEKTEKDYGEFYTPDDLVIGNTIFVFGKRFLIVDCDKATRDFYRDALRSEQPKPILDPVVTGPEKVQPLPKYTGFGSHEDSIQSFYAVQSRPPKTVVRCMTKSGNILRYTASLDTERTQDRHRKFVIWYRLSDGHIQVTEEHIPNSGFIGGKFLKYSLVPKQGTNPDNPEYVTPHDFYLGGKVPIFGHQFVIDGADLSVFRYMEANPRKFEEEQISDFRAYLMRKGVLTEDVRETAAFRRREEVAEPMFEAAEDDRPFERKQQSSERPDRLTESRQH